jgi:hypothetical protein
MLRTVREELAALAWLARTAAIAAFGAAVYAELRKPPEQRTWHGRLLGVVPYDFRLPTLQRIRRSYFDPSNDRVFTPEPIGVGWGVNVAAVMKRFGVLRSARERPREAKSAQS